MKMRETLVFRATIMGFYVWCPVCSPQAPSATAGRGCVSDQSRHVVDDSVSPHIKMIEIKFSPCLVALLTHHNIYYMFIYICIIYRLFMVYSTKVNLQLQLVGLSLDLRNEGDTLL